jgi:hypothetical protein
MITNFCEVISRSCFGANNRSDVKTVPSGNKATLANLLRIAVVLRASSRNALESGETLVSRVHRSIELVRCRIER